MATPMTDDVREADFNDWLESIEFINEQGEVIPMTLTDDESEDPEGDRGQI